jgi:phospholipid/cholesterol/gamma-HCH transport system substrate-binding protein
MITKRTKIQLVVFVLITLLGVSFVGAKYAQLDQLFYSSSYRVDAHFADSGGIFKGAEVTYRGVTIGRVGGMDLTDDGVDVLLDIDKAEDRIPAKTLAVVGNRSAVGEQYVELQPKVDNGPYLKDGSQIAQSDTQIPLSTTKWLGDTESLVNSVPKQDLRTVVSEFGAAFHNGGDDLTRLINSSTSFIESANANFDTTTALIRDSNTVLTTQVDKASAIRTFARNLALVSDTLVASDADLRRVIENGSATANQLRQFLQDNGVNLGKLINNLVTTNEVQIKHLDGIRMVMILYPYTVAGGFVVNDKDSNGVYNAHFGMILQQAPPVCHRGYNARVRNPDSERGNAPMDENAHCSEPPTVSDPRGAQNAGAGRVAPRTGPVVATYDRSTGKVTYTGTSAGHQRHVTYTGGAGAAFGKESWKWLLLQPLMPGQ